MAKFSKKMMGKEVGNASVYAEPHTSSGKGLTVNELDQSRGGKRYSALDDMRVSVGAINRDGGPEIKTSGIETRGNGAATKGRIARGPMC
jgi:hypothetical protein